MNAHSPPSARIGHIGCSRGPPSGRMVARKPRPSPNWYRSLRPSAAISGIAASNSPHLAIARMVGLRRCSPSHAPVADGLHLAYVREGEGGYPLLLVHG